VTRRFRYDPETDEVVEVTAPKRGKAADTAASRFSTGLHCEALGVDPRDVKWQRMEDEEVGIKNQEYDPHGAPVFYSRTAYNEYKRAHGYYDRNAGFGDVAPRNR
jgi:hypothetical protein